MNRAPGTLDAFARERAAAVPPSHGSDLGLERPGRRRGAKSTCCRATMVRSPLSPWSASLRNHCLVWRARCGARYRAPHGLSCGCVENGQALPKLRVFGYDTERDDYAETTSLHCLLRDHRYCIWGTWCARADCPVYGVVELRKLESGLGSVRSQLLCSSHATFWFNDNNYAENI